MNMYIINQRTQNKLKCFYSKFEHLQQIFEDRKYRMKCHTQNIQNRTNIPQIPYCTHTKHSKCDTKNLKNTMVNLCAAAYIIYTHLYKRLIDTYWGETLI